MRCCSPAAGSPVDRYPQHVADADRGQLVKAFVVLADGNAPSDDLVAALQDHVKSEIAPYKYPRAVDFVETLPKTQTGKVQRFKLRQT